MLSVRSLARSAPRTLGRMAAVSMRPSILARPAVAASFSTALRRPQQSRGPPASRAAAGETDDELSAKIESELQIEEDMKANEQVPSSVRDFLDNTPFELIDSPGQEVVKLVRDFNGEKITVSFSVADINDYNPYEEGLNADEDPDGDDLADQDPASRRGQTPGNPRAGAANNNNNTVDEDGNEEDEGSAADMDDDEMSVPTSLTIVVEKPGKTEGAISIEASIQDGAIVVDNMHYYDRAGLARVDSPDDAHRRAETYPGPPFGSLDEDLQVLIERYLEERGITQSLAVFVPDYVNVKEQAEYLRWLRSVKNFVDL